MMGGGSWKILYIKCSLYLYNEQQLWIEPHKNHFDQQQQQQLEEDVEKEETVAAGRKENNLPFWFVFAQ